MIRAAACLVGLLWAISSSACADEGLQLLSEKGQAVLARFGFRPVGIAD